MTDKKLTQEQFVREWMPEYEKRLQKEIDAINETLPGCVINETGFAWKHFPEALEAYADRIRLNAEMQIADLTDRLEAIKRVTPYSFQSLTEKDKQEGFYLAECECGWWGSSSLLEGGGAIADTGDHFDCSCPFCGSADIGDASDPYRHVWDQACERQRANCAQEYFENTSKSYNDCRDIILSAPAPEFKLTEE